MLGSRKCDVQTFFSAALIDGAEIHSHLTIRRAAIADAHDDHITLVALDVLQVLDQKADVLSVHLPLELGSPHLVGDGTGGHAVRI
jgi:hypothetical protein